MFRKIRFAWFIIFPLLFVSCSNSVIAKDDSRFSFSVVEPKTEIKVGEKVTYTAVLKNNTAEKYTLEHGLSLITLYIRAADDKTEDGIGATLVKTEIEANGTVDKVYNAEPLEAGKYVLRAYCKFMLDGSDYLYECEDIPITVVDVKS